MNIATIQCPKCGGHDAIDRKRSFLGFGNCTCPSCHTKFVDPLSPLSMAFRASYWILGLWFAFELMKQMPEVIAASSNVSAMFGRGVALLFFPLLFLSGAIWALIKDAGIRKRIAELSTGGLASRLSAKSSALPDSPSMATDATLSNTGGLRCPTCSNSKYISSKLLPTGFYRCTCPICRSKFSHPRASLSSRVRTVYWIVGLGIAIYLFGELPVLWSAYPEALLTVGAKHWQLLPFLLVSIWALRKDYQIKRNCRDSEGMPPPLPTNKTEWQPSSVDEGRIYAKIANEIDISTTDKGLWTRLFVQCDGDESKTKVHYIKQRFQTLLIEERERIEAAAPSIPDTLSISLREHVTIKLQPAPDTDKIHVMRAVAIGLAVIAVVIVITINTRHQPVTLISPTAEQVKEGERRAVRSWAEVITDPRYKALSSDDKEAARDQYFLDVVVPQISLDDISAARQQFDADTGPTVWNKTKLLLNLNR